MKSLDNFLQFEVFEPCGKAELKCTAFDFDSAWACGFVNCILIKPALFAKLCFSNWKKKTCEPGMASSDGRMKLSGLWMPNYT